MKLVYKLLVIVIFSSYSLYAEDLIESQPEIIFQFEKLKKSQENLSLQVDFNKAVLHLSKNEYMEAIKLFEKTSKVLDVPSYLNMGIAYYKLGSIDNAIVYLNRIYEKQENCDKDSFAEYHLQLVESGLSLLPTTQKAIDEFGESGISGSDEAPHTARNDQSQHNVAGHEVRIVPDPA